MRFLDSEVLPVSSTAVPLTQTKIDRVGCARATKARVQVRLADVVVAYTQDPVADAGSGAVGEVYGPGDIFEISGYDNLKQVQFIRNGATDASLFVSYGN